MNLWSSLGGMVTAELTSGDIPGRLRAMGSAGLKLERVEYISELTARFQIPRSSVKALRLMAKQKNDSFRVVRRQGIYWTAKTLAGRKLLTLGLALQLAVMLWLPGRVLLVEVEGNGDVPARKILEAAADCGIGFGASRRAVRSEKLKNELLGKVPELQWAGVNTYGCRAVITVREREAAPEVLMPEGTGTIVAARDGVILSATVTRGNSLCAPGQAVQEGEVLISGYTDCGLVILQTRAEGEVLAATNRELEVVTPSTQRIRRFRQEDKHYYSLIIGKKRINFYNGSGILDTSCVKMYSEYVLTLPGGFSLPVTLLRITCSASETEEAEVEPQTGETALCGFAEDYLIAQMIAGVITSREEAVAQEAGVYRLTGRYACREMIGRFREEIGEVYGKTSRTDGER